MFEKFKKNQTEPAIEAANYSKSDKLCGIAVGVLAVVFSLAIMHGDTTLIESSKKIFIYIPNYLALLFLLYEIIKHSNKVKLHIPLLIAWIAQWIISNFHLVSSDVLSIEWATLLLIIVFCAMNERVWHYSFRIYRFFLIIVSLFGIFAFLFYLTGVISPLRIVDYYNKSGGEGAIYVVYPLSYLVVGVDGFRLCGLFNEPGYFGTMTALVLIADGFNMKPIGNKLILVAGFFSFSIAFFVLIALYWGIRMLQKAKSFLIVTSVLAVLFFVVLPQIPNDSLVGNLLVNRMSYNTYDNRIEADARTTKGFDIYWEQAKINGHLVFGEGGGYLRGKDVGSLSYKKTIIEHGYFGAFLMWGLLFVACLPYRNKSLKWWLLVICFFASIYQRPSIYYYNYMVVLFGGMMNVKLLNNPNKSFEYKISKNENSSLCL